MARVSGYIGSIYWHLGYPLGVDVANVQLIDWIGSKPKDKLYVFEVSIMVLSCTTQSGAMYLDTHVIIFFTITTLD